MGMNDIQKSRPKYPLILNEVGTMNNKFFYSGKDGNIPLLINSMVSLNRDNKGMHMSRNIEAIQDILDGYRGELMRLPILIVKNLFLFHGYSDQVKVEIEADIHYQGISPSSGKSTREVSTIYMKGIGDRKKRSIRTTFGAKVIGMSACPCGQSMVREYISKMLLGKLSLEYDTVKKILDAIPIATHNQRSAIEASIETSENIKIDIYDLIRTINGSFSSEIYSLLKREDELKVILKAHDNPMFVEDSIRNLAYALLKKFGNMLTDSCRLMIRQENFESIHNHNAYSKIDMSIGELKRSLGSFLFMDD